MVCTFVYICKCNSQNCEHFVWRKLSKRKMYFTARMFLANSWRNSSACNNIINTERIRQLFKNKTGFYFWFGERKSQEWTKTKSPQKSSMSSLWGTEEEMAASRYFSDLRVHNTKKKPNSMSQTSQQLSPSFVPSHPSRVPLWTGCPAGTAPALLFVMVGGHQCWGATASATDPSMFPTPGCKWYRWQTMKKSVFAVCWAQR